MAAALLAAGCGGGSAGFFLTINDDFTTTGNEAVVYGTAALPQGSERAGGTPSVPFVTCQIGPYTLNWFNVDVGATGSGVALWDCPSDTVRWSAFRIPLAMGANRITVTMTDSTHSAHASVIVTRN